MYRKCKSLAKGHFSSQTCYITEHIYIDSILLATLGDMLGAPTSFIKALIEIASAI